MPSSSLLSSSPHTASFYFNLGEAVAVSLPSSSFLASQHKRMLMEAALLACTQCTLSNRFTHPPRDPHSDACRQSLTCTHVGACTYPHPPPHSPTKSSMCTNSCSQLHSNMHWKNISHIFAPPLTATAPSLQLNGLCPMNLEAYAPP